MVHIPTVYSVVLLNILLLRYKFEFIKKERLYKKSQCHGYFVKYDNYIYSPANIYNVHAISQYMKLTLWHHTINTALALDKFLIKAPPPHAH